MVIITSSTRGIGNTIIKPAHVRSQALRCVAIAYSISIRQTPSNLSRVSTPPLHPVVNAVDTWIGNNLPSARKGQCAGSRLWTSTTLVAELAAILQQPMGDKGAWILTVLRGQIFWMWFRLFGFTLIAAFSDANDTCRHNLIPGLNSAPGPQHHLSRTVSSTTLHNLSEALVALISTPSPRTDVLVALAIAIAMLVFQQQQLKKVRPSSGSRGG